MKTSMKRGGKSRFDRISSLPDELIGNILSNLPTRCAVSTSILSKRWRYLFTLTDCLSFDDAPCFVFTKGKQIIVPRKNEKFKEFVYKVLQLSQISPVKKFSLVCQGPCDIADLNAWVSNAVQKGVQEFHYTVSELHGGQPDGVLACETLVRLELLGYRYYEIKIPLSISLPSLKILNLDTIKFQDEFSMERLFSSLKLLEELTLYSCRLHYTLSSRVIISTRLLKVLTIEKCNFQNGHIEIDAPNLACLRYNCNKGVKIIPSWKYSCSFVKAELILGWSRYELHSYPLEYDREIFKGAAYKTTELSIISDSSVEFFLKLAGQEQIPEFHSLSKLHLSGFAYDSWKYVTNLLDKSPQLETLIFEKFLVYRSYQPFSPQSESLLPFSCHAQVIEVRNFCGDEDALLLLGHLLRNARFLKKLIVRPCPSSNRRKKEAQIKINKHLLTKLPRASSNCCIELRGHLLRSIGMD